MTVVLLDTSIQIKRLVSIKWVELNHDSFWAELTPVASSHTWMEFKNSLISALVYLISTLEEIAGERGRAAGDTGVRLSEVVQRMNIESTIYAGDRRIRLATSYAAKVLEEYQEFGRQRNLEEVIGQLRVEAAMLEEVLFFQYSRNSVPVQVAKLSSVLCGLAETQSPLRGNTSFRCRRDAFSCTILTHLREVDATTIAVDAANGVIKLKDKRLKEGMQAISDALAGGELTDGRSVGEKLCLPIGDLLVVTEAKKGRIGIFTADADQRALAQHLGLTDIYFYEVTGAIQKT